MPQTPADPVPAPVEAALADLAAAVRAGDVSTLLALAHPLAVEAHGSETCERYLETEVARDPGFRVRPRAVDGPGPVAVPLGLLHAEVPDAYRVDVAYTSRGRPGRAELVLATVDRELRWFPECARLSDPERVAGLVTRIPGDSRSEPLEVPSTWRVEAVADGPCAVWLHDPSGESPAELVGRLPWSFVVHRADPGTVVVEADGCSSVAVFAATPELSGHPPSRTR